MKQLHTFNEGEFECRLEESATFAIWSNLPKSSLSVWTSSPGEQSLASLVKPTMSAYRMLPKSKTVKPFNRREA